MNAAVEALFAALHNCPEISGCEHKTKKLLTDFIAANTSLEITGCGGGFYAAHREQNCAKAPIALRADYDALACPDGSAAHLCGHDGHSAALCLCALMLESKRVNRNVFFLFQPAEETGAGAITCLELFEKESVAEIYGAHNLPGYPLARVLTRSGTFAFGSLGLTLRFAGRPAHAAYPEYGLSPAAAVGELLTLVPTLSATRRYTGRTLCTVAGASMGEKAFGTAASDAELWLTIRAEHESELKRFTRDTIAAAASLAQKYGLDFSSEKQDAFPATENNEACAQKVMSLCHGEPLLEPMRWSEDFGHYLQRCDGAFFGIGAGENHAPLHTAGYIYPKQLLYPTADAFMALIKG